jgi:hypothetical protein
MLKRVLTTVVLASFALTAFADIPDMRLDGSWGKGEYYQDPYKYTSRDYERVAKNPHGIAIKKRIGKSDPGFAELEENLKALGKWDELDKELREHYVKKVKTEFDLSEKERQTAKAYPNRFPNEAKTGKRVYVSEVLKLGDKEYRVNNCRFFGKGDWNGDGVPEVFIRWDDYATHAGAQSAIWVFSENGDFVCSIGLMTLQMGMHRVYDYNGDGRVELVFMPEYNQGEYIVLGAPAEGEEAEPYDMSRLAPDEDETRPQISPVFSGD